MKEQDRTSDSKGATGKAKLATNREEEGELVSKALGCLVRSMQLLASPVENQPNPWVIVRVIEQNRYVVGRFPNQAEAQTQLWFLKRKLPRSQFEVVDEGV